MSANQPTSFRYPFDLALENAEGLHPAAKDAIRYAFTGLKDLNDAVKKLNTEVKTNTAAVTAVTNTVTQGGGSSPTPPPPTPAFGNVNLQPNLTPGAYTLAQSDLGGLILVQSAIAFALTLNSGLTTPFFASVYNLGTGTVTATPSLGNVNNGASVTLTTNQFGIFYFDTNGNWWEIFPLLAQSEPKVSSNWIDSYSATTGLFTRSQPAASDLSNGTTGGGKVVLDSGATVKAFSILGLPIFPNNASAISGGLVATNLYRTGADPDIIAVVH